MCMRSCKYFLKSNHKLSKQHLRALLMINIGQNARVTPETEDSWPLSRDASTRGRLMNIHKMYL